LEAPVLALTVMLAYAFDMPGSRNLREKSQIPTRARKI
jgi:hypothetical protein